MTLLKNKRVALISLLIILLSGNAAFAQVISASNPTQLKEAVI